MTSVLRNADTSGCCGQPVDAEWGRRLGAAPPLAWWLPVVAFAVFALVLSLVVVLLVRGPGPRDDPDPAFQRDGLLLDGPVLPEQVAGVRFGGRPVVVLFERQPPSGGAFERWRQRVSDDGVELVVPWPGVGSRLGWRRRWACRSPWTAARRSATRWSTRPGRRYATLDPAYLDNAFELDVITGAVAGAR